MPRFRKSDQRLANHLKDTEALLHRVKNEYELFFLQQLRRPPEDKLRKLTRMIDEMDGMPTNNTQLKFQRETLRSRFGSMSYYWTRTMHQIESGTYVRHRVVADRREQERLEREAEQKKRELEQAEAREKRRKRLPEGFHDASSPELLRAYQQARRHTGGPPLDERQLAQTIQKHAQAIQSRTGCKRVAFRVAVEDGKPRIKARPLKE